MDARVQSLGRFRQRDAHALGHLSSVRNRNDPTWVAGALRVRREGPGQRRGTCTEGRDGPGPRCPRLCPTSRPQPFRIAGRIY